jgi:hypothetical protein
MTIHLNDEEQDCNTGPGRGKEEVKKVNVANTCV